MFAFVYKIIGKIRDFGRFSALKAYSAVYSVILYDWIKGEHGGIET